MADWRHRAVCRDEDPELFFVNGNETSLLNTRQIIEAKTVCSRCPVRSQCLEYALSTGQDDGVWGGLSADERRVLKRQRRTWVARYGREAAEELTEVF